MPILYESKEDEKRVRGLDRQGRLAEAFTSISFLVAGAGGGMVARGFSKANETLKTIGWVTTVAGLVGVIANIWKGAKVSSEFKKLENKNVLLEGKPLRTGLMGAIDDMAPAVQGEPLPAGTEIVQGRKEWGARMAEQKGLANAQMTK